MQRVLLIEDDARLSLQLTKVIQEEGFHVDTVSSSEGLEPALQEGGYLLVVLDRLIGSSDLRDRFQEIKLRLEDSPILVISAINTPTERADLINSGADDYLGKPFITDEFIARVRALSRRKQKKKDELRKIGNASIDMTMRRISVGEKSETLPAREFSLLAVLTNPPGKVLSRSELLETVWGNSKHAETNLVEATITNLRKRLSNIKCNIQIKNQKSIGYWIES